MSTLTGNIAALYADVVTDVVPFFEDTVLLPNRDFIMNFYDLQGSVGNTVKIPVVNAYTDSNSISEATSISTTLSASEDKFDPTAVSITMSKRGGWTDVSEESVEDGGLAMVTGQVLTRLARGLAQSTDLAGFETLADSGATNYGIDANVSADVNVVMGPESLGYAVKREPTVRVWYNPDTDAHEFRATIRNGFAAIRTSHIGLVAGTSTIADASNKPTLAMFQEAVSNLRSQNAPTYQNGMYAAFISPATEYALVSELASNGGSFIGDLSIIGNEALRTGMIGAAVGCMFFRSNNLKTVADASGL